MKEFFKEIGIEFKKVTWPTDKEMKTYSVQVFAFMAIMILFFAVVDGTIARGIALTNPTPIVEEYDYDNGEDYEEETGSEEETSGDEESTE